VLDEAEPDVDRGVPGSCGVGAVTEDSRPFDRAREAAGEGRLDFDLD
jgi:hypothetical protein